jgi:glycosyltransferase involved in cell wall biosynthesis
MKTIGLFPFGGPGNPYTEMLAEGIGRAGYGVKKIQDTKVFPLRRAVRSGVDALHILWPGNLYHSSTRLGTWVKEMMFADGIRCLASFPSSYSADNLYPHNAVDVGHEIRMVQKILDKVRAISVASAEGERLLRSTYRIGDHTRIFQIPHRNYIGQYPDNVSKAEARVKLGLPPACPVVLSLGRITPYKGLPELVRAFAQVDNQDAILLIAGSEKKPGAVDAIVKMARDCGCLDSLRLHPHFVRDDDIQYFLRAADLMALSYEDVPMNPGSVLLAMSFDLPVVCVHEGSVPEILGEALYGYPRGVQGALTSALNRALANISDLREKGRLARRRAESLHSSEIVSEGFCRLFDHVAR